MTELVDIIGQVVDLMPADMAKWKQLAPSTTVLDKPKYFYGSMKEINSRLTVIKATAEKYPAILFVLPFKRMMENDLGRFKLNIGIVTYTKHEYYAPARYANNITPTLRPLYESFLRVIRTSGLFHQLGPVKHGSIDRLYVNEFEISRNKERASRGEKNLFNDPLDAIEIVDLEVKVIENLVCI